MKPIWGRGEACTRFWWGNLRETDNWGEQDVDWRIVLRWIFRKWNVRFGMDCTGS
jgi:hypothetical protein